MIPTELWIGSLALLALLTALALLPRQKDIAREQVRKRYTGWRLVYSDERKAKRLRGVVYSKLLRAESGGLTGKPDMIFKRRFGRGLMPVELKSGRIKDADAPHEGDLLQLAAYFVIIEEAYGVRPKLGRIVYSDGAFRVWNTRALRQWLADTMARMRHMLEAGEDAEEANSGFAECRYCLCKQTVCAYSYFGAAEWESDEEE